MFKEYSFIKYYLEKKGCSVSESASGDPSLSFSYEDNGSNFLTRINFGISKLKARNIEISIDDIFKKYARGKYVSLDEFIEDYKSRNKDISVRNDGRNSYLVKPIPRNIDTAEMISPALMTLSNLLRDLFINVFDIGDYLTPITNESIGNAYKEYIMSLADGKEQTDGSNIDAHSFFSYFAKERKKCYSRVAKEIIIGIEQKEILFTQFYDDEQSSVRLEFDDKGVIYSILIGLDGLFLRFGKPNGFETVEKMALGLAKLEPYYDAIQYDGATYINVNLAHKKTKLSTNPNRNIFEHIIHLGFLLGDDVNCHFGSSVVDDAFNKHAVSDIVSKLDNEIDVAYPIKREASASGLKMLSSHNMGGKRMPQWKIVLLIVLFVASISIGLIILMVLIAVLNGQN